MRKTIYNIIMCGSLLTLAGCSSDTDNNTFVVCPTDKQPIELCVGVDNTKTRAVVTDGTGKTLKAFTATTGLWMVMKSEFAPLSGNPASLDDLDFKGNSATSYCVTYATTGDKVTDEENKVNFTAENTRYWDDAHARSSKLSVWAIAVPGKTGALKANPEYPAVKSWTTTAESTSVSWAVSAAQTATTVAAEDLCFSNNIAESDARMKFNTNSRSFDKGKLIFYHALTKITVKLVEGEGFDHTSTDDFNFDSGNVTLKGFNVGGTFDVAEGEFDDESFTSGTITSMACGAKTKEGYTLEALVMPGTDLNSTTLADAVAFSIDGSAFEVSAATLKQKLVDGGESSFDKFEAGKNYVFIFTIKKTGIDVTATLADWNEVNAQEEKIDNSHIQFTFSQFGTACGDFKFYKSAVDLGQVYTENTYTADPAKDMQFVGPATLSGTAPYTTNWYYENNKTAYHFRTLNTKAASGLDTYKQYFTMTSGNDDYHWGAPMKSEITTIPYDNTYGFKSSISKGVSSATKESVIEITEIEMMSKIVVNLQTTTGDNKVDLSNSTVKITSFSKTGSVDMGIGLVTPSTTYEDMLMTKNGTTFTLNVVPQLITRSGDAKVGMTIETDDDRYFVDLSTIIASTVGTQVTNKQTAGSLISQWYPGHKYTYTITVTKAGIQVKALLIDWNSVSASTSIWM